MKIHSQSYVNLIDYMGSDLSTVNAARVSFAKESDWDYEYDKHDGHGPAHLNEKDQKLISYLAKHNHWTPFAHTSLTFRIKAPIFVARQLAKHQVGLVWNEVSRRYVDDEPEFFFPKEWRGRPVNAKQGSSGLVDLDLLANACASPSGLVQECLHTYSEMIALGIAPEQARMMLPQNTMTEWWWTGSLAAFARVCNLRLDPHAQQETREVAEQITQLIPKEFTYSWKALINVTK